MARIREDEFNTQSATAQMHENFEFGHVFTKNDSLTTSETTVAPKTELNKTDTNNDTVSETALIKKNKNDSSVLDTIKKNQGAEKVATNTASVSTTAVETVTALTITVVSVATGISIINSEPVIAAPDVAANIVEVRSTASYIEYKCNIEEGKDGDFAILLVGDDYEEMNPAEGGDNVGRFSDLTLGQTYILKIIDYIPDYEEPFVLKQQKVVTENLTIFDSFSLNTGVDMQNCLLDVDLEYVDDFEYYQQFLLTLSNPESNNERTIELDKCVGTQTVDYNNGEGPYGDFSIHTWDDINYSFSVVTTENGSSETKVIKSGKTVFIPNDMPTEIGGYQFKPYLNTNLALPFKYHVDQGWEHLRRARITLYSVTTGTLYTSSYIFSSSGDWGDNWLLAEFGNSLNDAEALRTELANGADFEIKLVQEFDKEGYYIPPYAEGYDFYEVPLGYDVNDELQLYDGTIHLEIKEVSEIYSMSVGPEIINGFFNIYANGQDDTGALMNMRVDVVTANRTYQIPTTYETLSTIYLEHTANVVMTTEEIQADIVSGPCDVILYVLTPDPDSLQEEMIATELARVEGVEFYDQYKYEYYGIDFCGYGFYNNKMNVQVFFKDNADAPLGGIILRMYNQSGDSADAWCQSTTDKQTVEFTDLSFDPISEPVTIEVIFNQRDLQNSDYMEVVKETFTDVSLHDMPLLMGVVPDESFNYHTQNSYGFTISLHNSYMPESEYKYLTDITAVYTDTRDGTTFSMECFENAEDEYLCSFNPIEQGINPRHGYKITVTATSMYQTDVPVQVELGEYSFYYIPYVWFSGIETSEEVDYTNNPDTAAIHIKYTLNDDISFFSDFVIRYKDGTHTSFDDSDVSLYNEGNGYNEFDLHLYVIEGNHVAGTTEEYNVFGIGSDGNEYLVGSFSARII